MRQGIIKENTGNHLGSQIKVIGNKLHSLAQISARASH